MAADSKLVVQLNDELNVLTAKVLELERELRQARADERRLRARIGAAR